jgi:hypothetical protein
MSGRKCREGAGKRKKCAACCTDRIFNLDLIGLSLFSEARPTPKLLFFLPAQEPKERQRTHRVRIPPEPEPGAGSPSWPPRVLFRRSRHHGMEARNLQGTSVPCSPLCPWVPRADGGYSLLVLED